MPETTYSNPHHPPVAPPPPPPPPPTVTFRVLVAGTGVTYKITLPPSEITVANIRRHMAAAVPPNDQILLVGPPYKVPKDVTLQSAEMIQALMRGDAEDDFMMQHHQLQQQQQQPQVQQEQDETSNVSSMITSTMQSSGDGATTAGSQPSATELHQQSPAAGDATTTTTALSESPPVRKILSQSERSGARRLFLFSKQALLEQSADPTPCHLEPSVVELPTYVEGPSPLSWPSHMYSTTNNALATPPSPLYQAALAYERQFMLYLAQGRVLADAADLRWQASRGCLQEQAIMARALRAAVSNWSDHVHAAQRTRAEFTTQFAQITAQQGTLLQRFEAVLHHALADIPLHPVLIQRARVSGRTMETLLDTVPVDRERAWAQQCAHSHQRLLALFRELDTAFGEIGNANATSSTMAVASGVSAASASSTTSSSTTTAMTTSTTRPGETMMMMIMDQDSAAEHAIEEAWHVLESVAYERRDRQAQRLERLTAYHQRAVHMITAALNPNNNDMDDVEQQQQHVMYDPDAALQQALTPLREMSAAAGQELIPAMVQEDQALLAWMVATAEQKTVAIKRMKTRLRDISLSQSHIQRCLAHVAVLRDALEQQTDNLLHLEHVVELPDAYHAFVMECRRRRAYSQAVTAVTASMMDRLAALRQDEVKARERFLRGPGRHLMPSFYDIFVPTLATPPPLLTPHIPAPIELDTVPDLGTERGLGGNQTQPKADVAYSSDAIIPTTTTTTSAATTGGGGVSSASSLTAEVESGDEQHQHPKQAASGAAAAGSSGNDSNINNPDQLIVSADGEDEGGGAGAASGSSSSGGGAMMVVDPSSHAQVQLLSYENVLLRQTIERLGGKAPPPTTTTLPPIAPTTTTTTRGSAAVAGAMAAIGGAATAEAIIPVGAMTQAELISQHARLEQELVIMREELAKAKASAASAKEEALVSIASLSEQQRQQDQEGFKVVGKNKLVAQQQQTHLSDKISHSRFEIGDVGLFMPTGRGSCGKRTYLAFHSHCPHRYLSTDCIQGTPDFVLGRIVYQEELVAGEFGTDANPYGLPVGTKFWVLTVEVLKSQI